MDADKAAKTAGALFLIAMVTSLGGGIWLETMVAVPDYLATLSASGNQVMLGVLLELVNCAAVVGIAAALYPVLKRQAEGMAMGYVGFRVIEATVLALAAICPLVLVGLSQAYLAAGSLDAAYHQSLGSPVLGARAQLTGLLTPIFFGLGALLLYTLLYRSRLVPRFISAWGLIAVVLMLAWNLAANFGMSSSAGMIFVLPLILNEILLGIWLIVKGFDPSAVAPLPAQSN